MIRPAACLALAALGMPLSHAQAEHSWPEIPDGEWAEDGSRFGEPQAIYLYDHVLADDGNHKSKKFLMTVSQRIKVLRTGSGVEDITLPAYENEKEIRVIKARTVHPDGRVFTTTQEDILSRIAVVADDGVVWTKTIPMPGVEAGTIIDLYVEYELDDPNVSWAAQKEHPVLRGEYRWRPRDFRGRTSWEREYNREARVPNYLWLHGPQDPERCKVDTFTRDDGTQEVVFTVADLPGVRPTPFSLPGTQIRTELMTYYGFRMEDTQFWQWMTLGTMEWIEAFDEEFKNLDTWGKAIAKLPTAREKIDAAFDLVVQRVEPDRSAPLQRGRPADVDPARAVEDGRGTSFEMSILLWRILRRARVNAGLAFLRDRRTGVFVPELKHWQFNAAVVVATDDDNRPIYCAPGEKGSAPGWLPWYYSGVQALQAAPGRTGLGALPLARPDDNRTDLELVLHPGPDASVAGTVRWTRTGNPARDLRLSLQGASEIHWSHAAREELSRLLPQAALSSVRVAGISDSDQPLVVEAAVEFPGCMGRQHGNTYFRPFRALPGPDRRIAELPPDQPIVFRYPYRETVTVSLAVPEGRRVLALPSGEARGGFAGRIETEFREEDGVIVARREFRLDQTSLAARYLPLVTELFARKSQSRELIVAFASGG